MRNERKFLTMKIRVGYDVLRKGQIIKNLENLKHFKLQNMFILINGLMFNNVFFQLGVYFFPNWYFTYSHFKICK